MAKNQKQQTGYQAPARPNPGNWVLWIGILVAVAVGGGIAWAAFAPTPGGGVPQAKIVDYPIECGNPCQPHKRPPENIEYKTDPPTSGLHYDQTVKAGFYDVVKGKENLVHNLEHGNIVIYYDPKISDDVKTQLKGLAERNKADFAGVVVVPRPEGDSPLILTAWGHMMKLQGWDKKQIDGFLDKYIGRGPEGAMR